jgi:multicomponent Na+:H+ antiporter subunit C
MEVLMSIVAGLLFSAATYLMLSKSLLRIIIGTGLLSHGAHLLILTMGGLKKGAAPLLGEHAGSYVDPLPQALILTAIVISFGVLAFTKVSSRWYRISRAQAVVSSSHRSASATRHRGDCAHDESTDVRRHRRDWSRRTLYGSPPGCRTRARRARPAAARRGRVSTVAALCAAR